MRALVRNPETAKLPPQAQIVPGDLTVPGSLDRCLEGVDAVFLVWTAPAAAAPAAVERIARRAPRIVFLSNLTVGDEANEREYVLTALHAHLERAGGGVGRAVDFLAAGRVRHQCARLVGAPDSLKRYRALALRGSRHLADS